MAAKLKKLLKRDVFALAEGQALGQPADLLVDAERHRVALLLLTAGSVPETSVVAPASAVQSFDSDTLAIEGLGSLRVAGQDETTLELLRHGLGRRGRPVLNGEGRRLGRITEVLIDESGAVTEYRVRKRYLGALKTRLGVRPAQLRAPAGEFAIVDQRNDGAADRARENGEQAR